MKLFICLVVALLMCVSNARYMDGVPKVPETNKLDVDEAVRVLGALFKKENTADASSELENIKREGLEAQKRTSDRCAELQYWCFSLNIPYYCSQYIILCQ